MSNEVILNLSFDNQTVTDLTGKWTLDGTPNATYEQIEGRNGYSIVTGSLGRCIVLNAVDQNAVYNEYTVDFDMFVKSTYTSNYYIYTIIYMWSRINPGNEYSGQIGNMLDICLEIGGSEPTGTTNYSPIGRWVHVTLTSGPTGVDDQYRTTAYVDGVKLLDRTDGTFGNGVSPFALSQQILLLTRDTDAKLMPNGPGICLNTFKVVTGIHMPNQKPAISLLNLSRVFNNFCTWLKGQLSTVAFTGSYNDLSNKPTISTVNDGTLTIQQNGTNVQTFTANASTNATANITVPTKTSDLTNDSGFITSDNTKIPLAGSNQISGSLIPSTDNSIDIGSSTKNIKMLYTKGITINGTQFLPSDYIPKTGSNQISGDLIPSTDGTVNLGSSSKKFASLNGIAPDDLGLPTSTYTDVSSYITNFDNTPNDFTASVSGLLYIQGSNFRSSFICAVANNTKAIYINGAYASGYNRLLVPVEKNDFIRVYIESCTLDYARIIHLKGKV